MEMLKKFGMDNLKLQATLMSSSTKLDKDEEDINLVLRDLIYKPLRELLGTLEALLI
ncbi:hypothetical protein PVK06_035660 [Gossypium arboreum]|uniref:Uncharacterized protein n=1 Tax=Gossypium arboreum TaxID=29729 RepID=A0ABR0NJI7_GOSAR|nr:hypothetical protein PVK06_035660 [Gossypium arboreum]